MCDAFLSHRTWARKMTQWQGEKHLIQKAERFRQNTINQGKEVP